MGIGDRLRKLNTTASLDAAPLTFGREENVLRHEDPLALIKTRASEALFSRLGQRLFDANLSESQLQSYVVQELDAVLEGELQQLSAEERHEIVQAIGADILGLGPIEQFMSDPDITEVMVNADDAIYIERNGRLFLTDARFVAVEHLRQVIERIVASIGRRIDESSPMVDARLPDGSRVNAVIPPLAVDGPMLTIRKFAKSKYSADELAEIGTLNEQAVSFLDACVRGKRNILISGGTGSGKTTLLNAVSSFVPADERIVTIEDAIELQLRQRHVIRLEARPPNVEGKGAVPIRELVRNSLRMRPDRIIIGEVRGSEALDMLQAMNTGHEGSLSTLHANTTRDSLARLETMVLMAGVDLPIRAIREQVASALDVVVQLSRLRDGSRRVIDIAEVVGMEGDTITMQSIYSFDFDAGFDDAGMFRGELVPTGIRPMFSEDLAHMGIDLPESLLAAGYQQLNGAR